MPSSEIEHAVALAKRYRERAYAPYSGFAVGAALETESGELFGGANVENASYGLAICAERSAVVNAVSAGHRNFRSIAIAGPQTTVTVPCGACRQFLNEFNPQMRVAYTTPNGIEETTLDRLLPNSFGPQNLE
jgi:cytidine deaminase